MQRSATTSTLAGRAMLSAMLALAPGACRRPAPAQPARPPVTLGERGPAVGLSGGVGLEVITIVLEDQPGDGAAGVAPDQGGAPTGRFFAPFQDLSAGVSEESRDLWRRNGLRVFGVPLSQLDALVDALPVAGRTQRQWIALGPNWTEAVRGPDAGARDIVTLDSGSIRMDAGSMRFLARAWPVPAPDVASATPGPVPAALRVELAPRLVVPRARQRSLAQVLADPAAAQDQRAGQTLTRLAIDLISSGIAIAIVPESSGVTWETAPPSAPKEPGRRADQKNPPQPPPAAPLSEVAPVLVPGNAVGPEAPAPATLGQAMLTDALCTPRRGTRTVIFLVPHPPARFELLPSR